MSVASKKDDGKKWIQTSVAIACMTLAYVLMSFFETLSEWFDLESKVPYFGAGQQVFSVLIALGVFAYIMKTPQTSNFLQEVYHEVMKVVWPDRLQTNQQTIVIMIAVTIVGFILGFFDWMAGVLLNLIR